MLRTGYGKPIDLLVANLAEEFSSKNALSSVSVIYLDVETSIVRGLNGSSRFDGYGLTKAMVSFAKAALAREGVKLEWDEVDGLLHHAEAHRSGLCECPGEAPRKAMSPAERKRAQRAIAKALGLCNRCAKAEATAGKHCAPCVEYLTTKKREARSFAKGIDYETGRVI